MIAFVNVAPLGDLNQEHEMPQQVQEKKSVKIKATNGCWAEFFYDENGNCTHMGTGMRPGTGPDGEPKYVPHDVMQLALMIQSQGIAGDMCADHGTAVQMCQGDCVRNKK